jgi:hypothetical protein
MTQRPTYRLTSTLPSLMLAALWMTGCGTTAMRTATDQMLASDAVDQAVSKIDFAPLSGQKVFFETKYLEPVAGVNGIGFVNANYVASALRQQMLAAGVFLTPSADVSDIVVEARIGILGADRHDLTYGMPASNASSIATATAGAAIPILIPEVSLARKVDQTAAAKVACYAYTRESRERVWQSGTSLAKSNSKDTWVFGAGPFQKSSVQNGIRFAGSSLGPFDKVERRVAEGGYDETIVFRREPVKKPTKDDEIQQASGEKTAPSNDLKKASSPPKLETPPASPPAPPPPPPAAFATPTAPIVFPPSDWKPRS